MKRFDTRKQRLLALFLWGPLGLLLFGAGGVAVLADEWGLSDPAVVAGAVAGAIAMTPLLVLMTVRRMSPAEVRAGRHAFVNRDQIIRGWPQWTAGAIVAFSLAVGIFIDTAFGAAFIFTVMTLVTIGAWLTALLRKGLFQDPDRDSLQTFEAG